MREHRVVAGTQPEDLLQVADGLAYRPGTRGTGRSSGCPSGARRDRSGSADTRAGHHEIPVALVVAEDDVVARVQALDEVVLEQQRLGLGARDGLGRGDLRHHQRRARARMCSSGSTTRRACASRPPCPRRWARPPALKKRYTPACWAGRSGIAPDRSSRLPDARQVLGGREISRVRLEGPRWRWSCRASSRGGVPVWAPRGGARGLRASCLCARIVAEQHHVATRIQRRVRTRHHSARSAGTFHREIVREHEAIEAQLLAQDLLQPRGGEARGPGIHLG